LWAGFLICIVAFFSYPFFFVRFPITRNFPWANLLLFCIASVLLVGGLRQAFGVEGRKRTRILGSILAVLSTLIFALFIFVVFIFARQLPASAHAPQEGQKAPPFALADTNGRTVSLSELLTTPIEGKTPSGVLIIFYRGYW
jgi:hypothetical protein